MKRTFNLTTYTEDLDRYRDQDDLLSALSGFDGLELMHCGEDVRGVVPQDRIVGVHLVFFPYWYDFYTGDLAACQRHLGSLDAVRALYGGDTPDALLSAFRKDIDLARAEGAEYVVFHVSDCSDEELFTLRYRHTSREVAEAAVDLLNRLFPEPDGDLVLLMENLWHPGLTLTEPEVTHRLLSGVRYQNKGIMLDTGHLMHTDLSLRTQEEALAYLRHAVEGQTVKRIRVRKQLFGGDLADLESAHDALHRPRNGERKRDHERCRKREIRCARHRNSMGLPRCGITTGSQRR